MSTTSPLNLRSPLVLDYFEIQFNERNEDVCVFILFAQTNTKSLIIIIHNNKMILNLTSASDHIDFAWLLYSYMNVILSLSEEKVNSSAKSHIYDIALTVES
jgi:hypothetical protein